jgi:hypothetical protein
MTHSLGGEGDGRSIFWKTPDTALYSTYVSTLCTADSLYVVARLLGFVLLELFTWRSEYLHEEEIWGEDPVHMTSTGYKLAAEGLEAVIYEKRREEREVEEKQEQRPAKKP